MPPGSKRLELTWYNKDQALIPTEEGRYDYRWVSPRDPRVREVRPLVYDETVTGTRSDQDPDTTYSALADLTPTTDNLAIRGESGDVLRALVNQPELAERYRGKVKLVYIDPPFNTGEMFSHYDDSLEHSIWLGLMRDRLLDIKELLSEDGSVWVHLDDSENHRMRVVLDEVFGQDNFVAEAVWRRKRKRSFLSSSRVVPMHDTIVVYAVDRARVSMTGEVERTSTPYPLIRSGNQRRTLTFPAGAVRFADGKDRVAGTYRAATTLELHDDIRVRDGVNLDDFRVTGEWGLIQQTLDDRIADGGQPMVRGSGMNVVIAATRTVDKPYGSLWTADLGTNEDARSEIQALFPGTNPFDTPKPERLLERIIHIATNPGDIVLDVFGGSGTTAAVAHKMGRSWVTCELSTYTFDTFTVPRLTKVISGDDPGGITTTRAERVDATENGLPEGLSPEEAQKLTSLLNKAIKGDDTLKSSKDVKEVKARVRTRPGQAVVNWLGGGSFRTAHLAPAVLDHDDELGLTFLSADAADHDTLVASVAANLGFLRQGCPPGYHGHTPGKLLFVADGTFTTEAAEDLLDASPDRAVIVAAVAADPLAISHIRTHGPRGSRVIILPDRLLP